MRSGMTKAVVLLTMDADDVAQIAVPNPSIASRRIARGIKRLNETRSVIVSDELHLLTLACPRISWRSPSALYFSVDNSSHCD